jgi:Tfp pilus assembly protein FimV
MTIATAAPRHIDGFRIGAYQRPITSERRPAAARTASASPRPNYVARRLVAVAVTLLTIATLAVVISGVLASFGGGPAAASEVSPANTESVMRTHVARSGDTMWSIASTYRGDIDHGRYLDALIRANGGVGIIAGQAVQLP